LMWLAMEFVDGITFAAWLDTNGPMSLAEVVPFFEPLAKVVDATHKCGIIHRDLKPSNILIDRSGRPRLYWAQQQPDAGLVDASADFGLRRGSCKFESWK